MFAWKFNICATIAVVHIVMAGATSAARAADEFVIAFRLPKWQSAHFDDAKTAKQHFATVKQLGCEARQQNHGGHTDVSYRCAGWKTVAVGSDELVHQWASWLQKAGFETLHGHDAADGHSHSHAGHQHASHGEEVTYRLPRQSKKHFDVTDEADQFVAIVRALGCEVTKSQHGNHIDVSFSCADWKHAEFTSHETAIGWEMWLKEAGFETRHSH